MMVPVFRNDSMGSGYVSLPTIWVFAYRVRVNKGDTEL
jgi:hypothetical protein